MVDITIAEGAFVQIRYGAKLRHCFGFLTDGITDWCDVVPVKILNQQQFKRPKLGFLLNKDTMLLIDEHDLLGEYESE